MSNVWATMPYVQLSHKMFVICINNRQNQIFSEMSLRDVMELPNYGLCRTSTAVAPRLLCDGDRRSVVMTILRDATAINDGTTAIMAVSLRNHGDNGGATAVYAVQAPQWYRASGVTGVLTQPLGIYSKTVMYRNKGDTMTECSIDHLNIKNINLPNVVFSLNNAARIPFKSRLY